MPRTFTFFLLYTLFPYKIKPFSQRVNLSAHHLEKDYKWSSAVAHLQGEDDILVKAGPLLDVIPEWQELFFRDLTEEDETLRRQERTGRPLGRNAFKTRLEKFTSRVLKRQKPGPKKK